MNEYKVMLEKAQFVSILERMNKIDQLEDNMEELLKNSGFDTMRDACSGPLMMLAEKEMVVELLQTVMQDKLGFIDSFIYEYNYGRNMEDGALDENGNVIDISTAAKLYDYLVERV